MSGSQPFVKFFAIVKFMQGNVLRMAGWFSYNPKDFRTKVIPRRTIPGCTGRETLMLEV
jgi:hypothetical protein